jgi:MerR family redox-sensitive transcriptional activator SoxR
VERSGWRPGPRPSREHPLDDRPCLGGPRDVDLDLVADAVKAHLEERAALSLGGDQLTQLRLTIAAAFEPQPLPVGDRLAAAQSALGYLRGLLGSLSCLGSGQLAGDRLAHDCSPDRVSNSAYTLNAQVGVKSRDRMNDTMRIGEVAHRARVRRSRIRYYEAEGLLPEPERESGQRRYDQSVLRRLAVIDIAQRAGLSLAEIRELVAAGNEPLAGRLRELAERKLPEIDALIDRAERVQAWLRAATDCGCQTIDECGLFDDSVLPPRDAARSPALVP